MGGITSLSNLTSSKVTAIRHPLLPHLECIGFWRADLASPGEYQARMAHQILQEFYLNGAVVYIDDTVIYGANLGTFLERLDLVLERMARFNDLRKLRKYFLE